MTRARRPWRLQSDSLQIESDGRDAFDELVLCGRHDRRGGIHIEMMSPKIAAVIFGHADGAVTFSVDIDTGRVVVVDGSAQGIEQRRTGR